MILRASLIWLALASAAFGQVSQTGAGSPSASSYVGPQDIVGSAPVHYWGLEAVSKANAQAGTTIVNLGVSVATPTSCDFKAAPTGGIGVATSGCTGHVGQTPAQYAAHGSCTGTISGTTLTCASATATPVAGDALSDGNLIVAPVIVSSCGAFTGGAGTCTVGPFISGGIAPPTISVGETISYTSQTKVAKLYDQGSIPNDMTTGFQYYLPVCLGSIPCMGGDGAATAQQSSSISASLSQQYSISFIGERLNNFTNAMYFVVSGGTAAGTNARTYFTAGANSVTMYAGTAATATATDQQIHSLIEVFNNASSTFSVDGTNHTVTSNTGVFASGVASLGGNSAVILNGYMDGVGIWNFGLNNTQIANLCHNQYSYYNTYGKWSGASC